MFYVWRQDWNCPHAEDVVNAEAFYPYSLYSGEFINVSLPALQLTVPDVGTLCDVVVNPWGYLVWSSRLRAVLTALTSDPIQYLPAIVHDLSGRTSETYMLANPLAQVDAVDEEHSSLLYSPDGYIEGIKALVLNDEPIGKRSLFRLNSVPADVIVRENVAKGVIQSGCTGCSFISITDYKI